MCDKDPAHWLPFTPPPSYLRSHISFMEIGHQKLQSEGSVKEVCLGKDRGRRGSDNLSICDSPGSLTQS